MCLTTRWMKIRHFILGILFFFAASFPVYADTVTVNVTTLNVRSGPGLNFEVIAQISQGSTYPVLAEQNEWIQIELGNGQTGWVANWLVDVKKENESIRVAEAKVEVLNVRSGPSTSFSLIDQISPGETYPILEEQGEWYKIQLSEKLEGWVANWLVEVKSSSREETTSSQKKATINTDLLNVRSGPGTTYNKIAQLTRGTIIEILDVKDGWYKIEINGTTGWIAGQYAETEGDANGVQRGEGSNPGNPTVKVNTKVLNLRSDPSLEAKVISQLSEGTEAELLKREGEWAEIRLKNGQSGWVAGWLIAETSASIGNQPTVTILNQGTNLRSGPSTTEKVIAKANEGEVYPVISTVNDWYQIQLKDGQKAYVAGWIVAVDGLPAIVRDPFKDILKDKVIVIDPGHGGKDTGAIGTGKKTKEKDLNLEVSKILATKLQAAGAKVILTRKDDTFIELEDRVSIAVNAKADAFISIHHNTYKNSQMNGTITFHYTNGRDKTLAKIIQAELVKRTGLRDLGERYGNYYVLRENPRLAVLVELGFLTNLNEELVLRSDKFQENAAEGIFQGIIKYFK